MRVKIKDCDLIKLLKRLCNGLCFVILMLELAFHSHIDIPVLTSHDDF